jgi:aarF domain-containing kinase
MYDHILFLGILLSMDLAFYTSKIKHFFRNFWAMGTLKAGGFEDDIEESMRDFAKDNFGFEIKEGAFEG